VELTTDPDPARAKAAMQAMMEMIKIDVAALERAVADL
jgi:predicted 3-demethylubiquinone-9 3-methyltransferase (glyoxalase superfamily)